MKKFIAVFTAAWLLLCSLAVPQAKAATQLWTRGWDVFTEPLDLTKSSINWSVASTGTMSAAISLVGANPSKIYEVAIAIFNSCTGLPLTRFGRFAVGINGWGDCTTGTHNGTVATVQLVPIGAIVTDAKGAGTLTVHLGKVASGSYQIEFVVLNGGICGVTIVNGSCDTPGGYADFQSPGPFGTTTLITVP